MIDPTKITDYNRSDRDLEEFALFCVMVAGKDAIRTASVLGKLIITADHLNMSPFEYLRDLGDGMRNTLVVHRVGQYNRIEKAFKGLLALPSLRDATLEDLLNIHGIGPKTARFFILHSRENAKVAVLDTHILKWMSRFFNDCPTVTPPAKHYYYWENAAMAMMNSEFPGMSYAQADLLIWMSMSGRLSDEYLYVNRDTVMES